MRVCGGRFLLCDGNEKLCLCRQTQTLCCCTVCQLLEWAEMAVSQSVIWLGQNGSVFRLPSASDLLDEPSIVALTVERIFSWVAMVGIRSQTCRRAWISSTIISSKWQFKRNHFMYHSHLDVGAKSGDVDSESGDLFGWVGDGLRAVDQVLLRAALSTHELRESGHEDSHSLGGRDDVVLLTRPLFQLVVQSVGGGENRLMRGLRQGVSLPERSSLFLFIVLGRGRRSRRRTSNLQRKMNERIKRRSKATWVRQVVVGAVERGSPRGWSSCCAQQPEPGA